MRIAPAARIAGALEPPADKSISHRAALIAAMSDGESRVRNYLHAADTLSTLRAVRQLGAAVEEGSRAKDGIDLVIDGVGLRGARASQDVVDVGNAGTLLRLLPGWLAGQTGGHWTIDGDASIRRRPVDRIAEPLERMGAQVECRDGRLPPVLVHGAELEGIRYALPVASAQVKSCVLLAGLLAHGETTVVESIRTRDHTELMLTKAGVGGRFEPPESTQGAVFTVKPVARLDPVEFRVPGDFSSGAFYIVAATLVPGSDLLVKSVSLNPTRTGLLTIMERMGASIDVEEQHAEGGEAVGDLRIRHAELRGATVEPAEVPLAIDELPLVALLGVFADGTTRVTGAQELRQKESDRIATVVAALSALGAQIEATEDGFVVEGTGMLRGGAMHAGGDHRLAMLGAVAGLASKSGVEVEGFGAVAVSYPGFESDLNTVSRL